MSVDNKKDLTLKHLRNLLILCKEGKFEFDGNKAIIMGEAFSYLLAIVKEMEEELKAQADD